MRNSRWLVSCLSLVAITALALAPVAASADPSLSGLSSSSVPLDSFISIYGSGFGSAQGSSYVTIGGRFVPALAWTDGVINIYVNPLAYNQGAIVLDTAYPVQVVIPSTGKSSNTVNLTITSAPPFVYTPAVVDQITRSDQPAINSFQVTAFDVDDVVAILGSGFGDTQGTGNVTVTVSYTDASKNQKNVTVAIPVIGWSENAINAVLQLPTLPTGAKNVSYQVTVNRSNGKTATSAITITSVDVDKDGD